MKMVSERNILPKNKLSFSDDGALLCRFCGQTIVPDALSELRSVSYKSLSAKKQYFMRILGIDHVAVQQFVNPARKCD